MSNKTYVRVELQDDGLYTLEVEFNGPGWTETFYYWDRKNEKLAMLHGKIKAFLGRPGTPFSVRFF